MLVPSAEGPGEGHGVGWVGGIPYGHISIYKHMYWIYACIYDMHIHMHIIRNHQKQETWTKSENMQFSFDLVAASNPSQITNLEKYV